MSYTTSSAVLVVLFKRAAIFARTMAAVQAVRPPRLYIAIDATRPGVPGEAEACAATKALLLRMIDWPCQTFFTEAPANLGGSQRMVTAINWIFQHEERAIIIEEDCLAHPTFFRFCDELLERYANDERVAMISGDQFVPGGWPCAGASYAFVRLGQIWGWATWRRAWRHYDDSMAAWPEARRRGDLLRRIFRRRRDRVYWRKNFDDIRDPGCWDYRWCFARWSRNQVAVVPGVNVCANIGFGPGATHTTQLNHPAADVPLVPMTFPLRHPASHAFDDGLDAETTRLLFSTGTIAHRLNCHWQRLLGRIRRRFTRA